jgi:hypothetical protein
MNKLGSRDIRDKLFVEKWVIGYTLGLLVFGLVGFAIFFITRDALGGYAKGKIAPTTTNSTVPFAQPQR